MAVSMSYKWSRHHDSDLWIQRMGCVNRCLGKLHMGWMQILWLTVIFTPLFTVKSLPMSSTEYLHFFLTGELQDSELHQPLLNVMQLFLDALWRDLSAQAPCGQCVQRGPDDEVVLPRGLGYVFPPTEFWATLTSVYIFLIFSESCYERPIRGPGPLRSDDTQMLEGVQAPGELGGSPLISLYRQWWTRGSVWRGGGLWWWMCPGSPANG